MVRDVTSNRGKFPASFDTYQVVEPGDLVLCMFDVDETPRTIGMASTEGMITGAYDVYRCADDVTRRFILRLLIYLDDIKGMKPLYRGLRKTVPRQAFESMKVGLPDPLERQLIVRYLDDAELRISHAIRAQTTTLNLLTETRRAVISERVLGVGGAKPLFDGSPYLVPDSWATAPFWTVAAERSETNKPDAELLSVFLDRGVIRYAESAGQVHKPKLDLHSYQVVKPGDLVLNNQQAWRGSLGVSSYEGIVSPAYVVCELRDQLDPTWANLMFRSPAMVDQFKLASRGVGSIQRQIHRPSLRVTRVPIPPLEEQRRIAASLAVALKDVDAAIRAVQDQIDLLGEYRTRLVGDVIMGAKDIRDEASQLADVDPEELIEALVPPDDLVADEELRDAD